MLVGVDSRACLWSADQDPLKFFFFVFEKVCVWCGERRRSSDQRHWLDQSRI
jgi:hypothetical protein